MLKRILPIVINDSLLLKAVKYLSKVKGIIWEKERITDG